MGRRQQKKVGGKRGPGASNSTDSQEPVERKPRILTFLFGGLVAAFFFYILGKKTASSSSLPLPSGPYGVPHVDQPMPKGPTGTGADDTWQGITKNHRTLAASLSESLLRPFGLLRTIPHSNSSFTQGLAWHDGRLLEGTGIVGSSFVQELDPSSGTITRRRPLPRPLFGEGITVLSSGRVIQLTYKTSVGFIYDLDSFSLLSTFSYATVSGQGWGIAFDASRDELVVSDGSSWLLFWDSKSLREKRRVQVRMKDGTVISHINELEVARGYLFANVWYTEIVLKIDLSNGEVQGFYDLRQLRPLPSRGPEEDCFNGIAYNSDSDTFFVTGKNWPWMFHVHLE